MKRYRDCEKQKMRFLDQMKPCPMISQSAPEKQTVSDYWQKCRRKSGTNTRWSTSTLSAETGARLRKKWIKTLSISVFYSERLAESTLRKLSNCSIEDKISRFSFKVLPTCLHQNNKYSLSYTHTLNQEMLYVVQT